MELPNGDSDTPLFPSFEKELPVKGSGSTGSRIAYDPIDINGAYHDGHLYYPVQTVVRAMETVRHRDGREEQVVTERLETVVVRSDRTVHTAVRSKAPRNTSVDQTVWRLGNVLIARPPSSNRWATWRWPSIHAYLEGRSRPRPLRAIMKDVLNALKGAIFLPRSEDYALLALVVPVTYLQAIFDAVPLVMVTGPMGTGKTLIGRYMARLCANSTIIGVVSPATIARQVDESRGFVVFDDIESVGRRKGRESAQFSELIQSLKLSYNKQTGVKIWTDVATMQTRKLNFYGVKLLSNTTGVDPILGSRMLRVTTGKAPPEFHGRESEGAENLLDLRDELHTWAFSNVDIVAQAYARRRLSNGDRADEIATPLHVIAELTGDSDLRKALDTALVQQRTQPPSASTPEDLLRNAAEELVKTGQTEISPLHLLLQMRCDASAMRSPKPDISKLSVAWVGRMLRTSGVIARDAIGRRKRLFGLNLNIFAVQPEFIRGTLTKFRIEPKKESKEPLHFCTAWECGFCRYAAHGCPMRAQKLQSTHPLDA